MKLLVGILTITLLSLLLILSGCSKSGGKYDAFTNCLTESNVKMFGAYWCPHCQSQEKTFGNSWNLVNYIECSLPNRMGQTEVCAQEKITSYPTWEFADGSRRSGALSLETLSSLSGCKLK